MTMKNQLAELEGWDTSDLDEDDSSEEPNAGSKHSVDGSQAAIEDGHSTKTQSDYTIVGSTSGPSGPGEMARKIDTSDLDPVPNRIDMARQENERRQTEDLQRF
ncbi:hypothetical protein B0H65DRAFT_445622 [Neurospora tetraspora]|uniref:Uncharacterized protein n=1 Tax=Neurospora tetraspora TaxID=94610 RepID=A0AAE0MPK5_9PEZI|nr:hypothetical protein B0H65DRAFT_445622 [Neurospora tetraspora]